MRSLTAIQTFLAGAIVGVLAILMHVGPDHQAAAQQVLIDSTGPSIMASSGLMGDANDDGLVDDDDLSLLLANWGSGGGWGVGDFDASGTIDDDDLSLLLANWGGSVIKAAPHQVSNLKIVTDARPDYYDTSSMIYSICSGWPATKDKCWAMFYWNHIARRQTSPMKLHGTELTDPIRQFNDYGYTQCSTISGINCGIWHAMGLPVKFWDISLHTVPEVFYDGRWHCYDNSMSCTYTLCDGVTVAGVQDIGAYGACAASNSVSELGHIALYHCVDGTSPHGCLTGADTIRELEDEAGCFNPPGLKYRDYYNNWDLGHRYILNVRENEVYTRSYSTQGGTKAHYVPNPPPSGGDPEAPNTRYKIRGNGSWTWSPDLTRGMINKSLIGANAVRCTDPGVAPTQADATGEVIFKVEGANVITSMTINATFVRRTAADVNAVSVSTNNGLTWLEVWRSTTTGENPAQISMIDQVNAEYEVLVKVQLMGKANADDAQLKSIRFDTVTMVNSKTQPSLRLGKNKVYVGTGQQLGSIVFWPECQSGGYKRHVVQESNVSSSSHNGYQGPMYASQGNKDAYVVFRLDAPGEIRKFTYGGRFYNRGINARHELYHSYDDGATWIKSYTLTDTSMPWDVIHYETITDVPAGKKSVLLKYLWRSTYAGMSNCGVFAMRMEANYLPADTTFKPAEVTFSWRERQQDYTTIQRSHTQLVDAVPFTYEINVGGADHPIVDSLKVNLKGAVAPVTYGYSDGQDVGGEKFQDRWVTYGKIISTGKPYTCTVPSGSNWGAWDDGTRLTDGIVGPPFSGGTSYQWGAIWTNNQKPVITVDLGQSKQMGAFRIHVGGYEAHDPLLGQVKDLVDVETSTNNSTWTSRGSFNFNLRWKDLPANHMWPDHEKLGAHNYELILPQPVTARYVRFKLTAKRYTSVSEVQVLESITYEPFDLKLALPAMPGGG